jgi:mannose-6-phosphate isomerase-like protein (cupin superfamily)
MVARAEPPTVTSLFLPALSSLADLVPHDGLLSAEELEEIATAIAERPEMWQPLVRADTFHRRYELLYEDGRMDAWVLSWMPGQGTGFHDHAASDVGICCAQGSVREALLRSGTPEVELDVDVGDRRRGGAGYVHRVRHGGGEPAVTIHVYSPRLDEVGQYRVDEHGIMRRESAPGRIELTP